MKYLIALLFPVLAIAEEHQAAGFQNNAGGWTVITTRDQYCGARNMNDGYAFGKDSYVRFCWTRKNNAISVVFESGENGIWSVDSFELLSTEPEFKGNKS